MKRPHRSFSTDLIANLAAVVGIGTALWVAVAPVPAGAGDANVLSIGGSVTEIVYALGQGHRLVARDTTSTYPQAANDLPDVGYIRALSAEGVLSVSPELILSEEGAGPPETVAALAAAAIPFVIIPDAHDAEGVIAKVRAVGEALGVGAKAEALAADLAVQFQASAARIERVADPKKVLFILSAQGGRILASGSGTAAAAIIGMAGGVNALHGFEGYKPVTDEAILAAAPDVILMLDRSGDHAVTDEALLTMPAIAPTPAAAGRAIVRLNGLLLLGFGPRTAEATRDLNHALYGE